MSVNKFVLFSCIFIINVILIQFIANIFSLYKLFCVLLVSPMISWFISSAIYRRICADKFSNHNKTILITGCDTGFGNQLAKKCDKLGFYVLAGCLNPDENGSKELKNVCSERVHIIKMDVTKHEDVVNAYNQIKCSGIPLWAVVNNAGISISGAHIEWGSDINQLNQIFSVNVFGAVRVAKLSLPLLRQTKGRIINVSSIASRTTVRGLTFYSMSKHAIRSFSDGLRKEVKLFGIKVIDIEPVLYRTPICDWNLNEKKLRGVWEETPQQIKHVYNEEFRKKYEKQNINFLNATRKQTEEVIDIMIKAITLKEPQNSYKCGGPLDFIFTFPLIYLPDSIQQFILIKILTSPILNLIMKNKVK